MDRQITLIELFKHHEVVASYFRILLQYPVKIHCLTNQSCYDQLKLKFGDRVEWHLQNIGEKNDAFLARYWLLLESQHLIVFTTIDIHSIYLNQGMLSRTTIGLVHNAHSFFFPLSLKFLPWSRLPKYCLYLFRLDFKNYARIRKNLDIIVLPDTIIYNHIRPKLAHSLQSKLFNLSISVPEKDPRKMINKSIIITIPGIVSQNRRDYRHLIDLLPELNRLISNPIVLYLLGAPKTRTDNKILKQLNALSLKYIEIKSFLEDVPADQYDAMLSITDFLLLPIKIRKVYRSSYEYRGKSCTSGNLNDMIRFSLPAIVPRELPLSSDVEGLVDTYKSRRDLLNVLTLWINKRHYNGKKDKYIMATSKIHDRLKMEITTLMHLAK